MTTYVVVLTFDHLATGRKVRTFGPHPLAENAEKARRRIHFDAVYRLGLRNPRTYVTEIEKEKDDL